ncbi:unnamed protein product, partial [Meganyctiphanes norvegica]
SSVMMATHLPMFILVAVMATHGATAATERGLNDMVALGNGSNTHSSDETELPRRTYVKTLTTNNAMDWGPWASSITFCDDNHFVSAFRIKAQDYAGGFHDDTGLNAIRLTCELAHKDEKLIEPRSQEISSSEGGWGAWKDSRSCGDTYATGMRLYTVPSQGSFADDIAATELEIQCNWNGAILAGGAYTDWGQWSTWAKCNS